MFLEIYTCSFFFVDNFYQIISKFTMLPYLLYCVFHAVMHIFSKVKMNKNTNGEREKRFMFGYWLTPTLMIDAFNLFSAPVRNRQLRVNQMWPRSWNDYNVFSNWKKIHDLHLNFASTFDIIIPMHSGLYTFEFIKTGWHKWV